VTTRGTPLRGWRRIAAAIWSAPDDPQSYGDVEVDASAMLAFIEGARERTGVHVTVLHLVGRAIAHALSVHPQLNLVPHGTRVERKDRVDVSFIVAFAEGEHQTGVTIEDVDRKSAVDVARELGERAERIRAAEDPSIARAAVWLDRIPRRLVRPLFRLAVWLSVDRGVDLSRIGIRGGGFGSVIVTSLGGLGIDRSYGLISPFSRVPFTVAVGRVQERAVVVGGEVVARPMLTISATLDHRYLDGSHAGRLAGAIREYCADPAAFEPACTFLTPPRAPPRGSSSASTTRSSRPGTRRSSPSAG
jgi:pyruvate dehydrogenase E2 component (dihydrolipoamide acetyltransferase)